MKSQNSSKRVQTGDEYETETQFVADIGCLRVPFRLLRRRGSKTFPVSGRVVYETENGKPAAGVLIQLTGATESEVITDGQGRWEAVFKGTGTATPSKEGFTFEPESITVKKAGSSANFIAKLASPAYTPGLAERFSRVIGDVIFKMAAIMDEEAGYAEVYMAGIESWAGEGDAFQNSGFWDVLSGPLGEVVRGEKGAAVAIDEIAPEAQAFLDDLFGQ